MKLKSFSIMLVAKINSISIFISRYILVDYPRFPGRPDSTSAHIPSLQIYVFRGNIIYSSDSWIMPVYPYIRDYRAFSFAVTPSLGTKHVESRVTVNYNR